MNSWASLKSELLKNPSVKLEYRKLAAQYQVAAQVIELRQRNGLTQAQLASKIGTKQSEIARIESGGRNLSVRTLEKIALATGAKLEVTLK